MWGSVGDLDEEVSRPAWDFKYSQVTCKQNENRSTALVVLIQEASKFCPCAINSLGVSSESPGQCPVAKPLQISTSTEESKGAFRSEVFEFIPYSQ